MVLCGCPDPDGIILQRIRRRYGYGPEPSEYPPIPIPIVRGKTIPITGFQRTIGATDEDDVKTHEVIRRNIEQWKTSTTCVWQRAF